MLTKKELKQLRNDIILSSVFVNDYNNTLFIKAKTASAFFDSYIDYLCDLASDDNFNGDIVDIMNKYDNIDNLYNYYLCYEDDPLLKDDFIATQHINNSDGIVIYSINDYSVIASCWFLSGLYMNYTPLKKYKLYNSVKNGFYFNFNKRRYYIKDFIRVNL